jgi:hypothetical protein
MTFQDGVDPADHIAFAHDSFASADSSDLALRIDQSAASSPVKRVKVSSLRLSG